MVASSRHGFGYDYTMVSGWEKRGEIIFINPKIYCERYLNAFGPDGKLWDYANILSGAELDKAKKRLLGKFVSN